MQHILNSISLRREPVVWLFAAVGAVITVARVLTGESLAEIFSEDWIEYVGGALLALLTRASVYSPDTHDRTVRDVTAGDA